MKKRLAIVGYFPDKMQSPVTQASELSKMLISNGYQVLEASKYQNKWKRLIDIIYKLSFANNKYDIAIVQFYSGKSFIWQYIAAKIVKSFRKKLIFTIHGGGVPDRLKSYPGRYLSLLKSADIITVPSDFIKETLKDYNVDSLLIENTIPLHNYPFYNKHTIRPVILWMRAFSEIYNPLMAVKVVAELKKKYPTVKMYMGGHDLGMLIETKQLITHLALQKNVEIVGFLNFNEKIRYSEHCDIYISTNKIDNAPVTFLEMWAMGLPVVSTNVGGVGYLINDNSNGLLANADDHVMMAQKITDIIENKELADKLIRNGKEKVKTYDEHVVYEKWENLLDKL